MQYKEVSKAMSGKSFGKGELALNCNGNLVLREMWIHYPLLSRHVSFLVLCRSASLPTTSPSSPIEILFRPNYNTLFYIRAHTQSLLPFIPRHITILSMTSNGSYFYHTWWRILISCRHCAKWEKVVIDIT